jgi:ABC-2 type transport system permease protein
MVNLTSKKPSLRNSAWKAFIFLLILGICNLIFERFFTRIDFTSERRFTLSKTTLQILANLKEPVLIQVYLKGDFPAPFKRLEKETSELLNEFSAYSHGNLQIQFIDPIVSVNGKESTLPDSLHKYGVEPTQIQVKTKDGNIQKEIYPGALIKTKGRILAINLMQNQNQLGGRGGIETLLNNSVEGLEYVILEGIKKVVEDTPPLVGLLTGNQEILDPRISDLVKTLKSSYRVGRVDINRFPLDSLIKVRLLILIKPNLRFTEIQKYKLDQFIMHGGRILGFLDPVNAELDSMGKDGSTMGFPKDLNLDDFLFRFGVRMNYNLIRDLNCAPIPVVTGNAMNAANSLSNAGNSGQTLEPWVYYPLVMPDSTHPIVRNLDPIRLEFASTLDTLATKGVKKTFLLSTSPYTKVAVTPTPISLKEVSAPVDDIESYKDGKQKVAVLLEGSFSSSFQHRNLEGIDLSLAFLPKSSPTAMIFVSDGNLPLNQINSIEKSIYPLGYDKYSGQIFGNKIFIQNAVEYLIDPHKIVLLRSKEVKLRMLNKPLVEERKSLEEFLNFLIPMLFVLLVGLGVSGYRYFKFATLGNTVH